VVNISEVIELEYNGQRTLNNYREEPREYSPEPYRRKYTQNWSAYNQAQTNEKFMFMKILDSLVESVGVKTYGKKTGRPPLQMTDMIKCCIMKVFNDFSARRTISDLKFAKALDYIERVPHFNSILNYLNNPYITQFLKEIIKQSSIPLAEYEKRFAVDSTGFSTFCKDKWVKIRLQHKKHRDYKKVHATCGVFTNIIVSAKVTEGNKADSPQFKELINEIAKDFKIKQVSADAAYLSRENTQAVEDLGGKPFIMPKSNTKALAKGHHPAWNKMINLFRKHESKFKAFYHLRSNIECTFSMIKRKFSPFVRSKQYKAQENELLAKIICHNISVLISSVFELDLDLKYLEG